MLSSIKFSFSTWLNWISGTNLKALTHPGHLCSAQIKQIVQCSIHCTTWKASNCSWEQTHVSRLTRNVSDNQQQFFTVCVVESAFPFEVKLNTASWINTMGKAISMTGVWSMCKHTPISLAGNSPWCHKRSAWKYKRTPMAHVIILFCLQEMLVCACKENATGGLLKVAGCAHYCAFLRLKKTDEKLCSFLILSRGSMRGVWREVLLLMWLLMLSIILSCQFIISKRTETFVLFDIMAWWRRSG